MVWNVWEKSIGIWARSGNVRKFLSRKRKGQGKSGKYFEPILLQVFRSSISSSVLI